MESDGLIVFIYLMYLYLLINTGNFKYEVLFPLVQE